MHFINQWYIGMILTNAHSVCHAVSRPNVQLRSAAASGWQSDTGVLESIVERCEFRIQDLDLL